MPEDPKSPKKFDWPRRRKASRTVSPVENLDERLAGAAGSPTRGGKGSPSPIPGKKKGPAPLKPASELQATAASFSKKAEAELKNVSSNERSLKVRMGDELVAKKVNVKELVASWAKRGEEPISKTEFRQHVRKMLDKTNAKEVDALFNELDEDHGGSLDVPEIRAALKKLQNAAAKRAEELAEMRAKADHFQMRANFASKAAQLTGELERTKKELEVQKKGSNNTFGQRLGMKLVGKGIKVGDLLLKWNDSKSGAISKGEWRKVPRLSASKTLAGFVGASLTSWHRLSP